MKKYYRIRRVIDNKYNGVWFGQWNEVGQAKIFKGKGGVTTRLKAFSEYGVGRVDPNDYIIEECDLSITKQFKGSEW